MMHRPSYDDVARWLREQRGAEVHPDGRIEVVARFRDPHDAVVEQVVIVKPVTVRERPWLLVYAEACPRSQLDSTAALAHGATLAVGALCALDDSYFLQHATPLATPSADLDSIVTLLAHEAARLRVVATCPVREAQALFAAYAE